MPEEFWGLTFHEFFCIQKGKNDRFEWERIRWLATCNLQPHTKKGQNLSPQKLVKFEWEKTKVDIDLEKQKERAYYINKKYEKLQENGK